MPKTYVFFLAILVTAGAALAQVPSVGTGGIVNHFSYAQSGMPNGSIAEGSVFDIYGTNIGPAQITHFTGFPIPIAIAGTSVQVTVSGKTTDAYLFFVSAGLIVGVLPSATPVGTGELVVTVNGQKSTPAPITVVARSAGIFTLNQAGKGPAWMQVASATGGLTLNSLTNSIKPSQIGVFYGTGAGPVSFDESHGAPTQDLGTKNTRAFVNGKEARILFNGRVPGLVGLDQFNIQIPSGISGCYATVVFQTGEVLSNITTISVSANGGQCPDPNVTPTPPTGKLRFLNLDLLRGSDLGYLGMLRGNFEITTDLATASAGQIDFSKIPPRTAPPAIVTKIGPCILEFFPAPPEPTGPPPPPDYLKVLDMGSELNITGPNGTRQFTKNQFGGLGGYLGQTPFGQMPAQPPLYLDAGTYTIDNGSGGKDVGPFKESLTYPANFVLANADKLVWTTDMPNTISRSQGLTVNWTGGDPNTDVTITGGSFLAKPGNQGQANVGAQFSCTEHGSVGHFTVPPQVLLYLPPSTALAGVQSTGRLVLGNGTTVTFSVPGIDQSNFIFGWNIDKPVMYK